MWEEGHWQGPDYDENGKKKSIQLWRFDRPHMRAFHFAWFAFLMCFIMWFVVPPLMFTIRKPKCADPTSDICLKCNTLFPNQVKMATDKTCKVCAPYDERNNAGCGGVGLTGDQVIISNAVSVLGTILVRVAIGAVADAIGVRVSYIILLVLSAIPGFCIAAVQTPDQLIAVRFLISAVGGSFVLTQLWTSTMFSSNIVGTANATSAGWGNLGGAIAGVVIPRSFNSFKTNGYDNDRAWRYAAVWPPAIMILVAVCIWFFTDDTPVGRVSDIRAKKKAQMADPNYVDDGKDTGGEEPASIAGRSLKLAAMNWRTWILFCSYALCFGVELVVYNNLPSYFADAFKQNQTEAAQTMTYFGCFNIFARSLGGIMSDVLNKYLGHRGRLWNQFLCSLLMGVFLLVFSAMTLDVNGYGGAIGALCAWALFLNMTEGAVFGVVPFVEPTAVGGVSGIVGAGGNAGALGLNFLMTIGKRPAFAAIGWMSLWSAIIIPVIWLPNIGSMFKKDTSPPAPIFFEEPKAEEEKTATKEVAQEPSTSFQYPAAYGGVPFPAMPYGHPGSIMTPYFGSPPAHMMMPMPPPMQVVGMPFTPAVAGSPAPALVMPMGY